MFNENCIKCDVCGFIMNSFGCCRYGDEKHHFNGDGLCTECRKACKGAKEYKEVK